MTKHTKVAAAIAAVVLLTAAGILAQTVAHQWKLSPACKPKLRIAFEAVREMDPLAPEAAYEAAIAEAKKELRQAHAVATTMMIAWPQSRSNSTGCGAKSAMCKPVLTGTVLAEAGVIEWQVSYGLGLAKTPSPR